MPQGDVTGRDGGLIPAQNVLTAIRDGALIIAHAKRSTPVDLSVYVDGGYVGPLECRADPTLKGAGLKAINQIADPDFQGGEAPWALQQDHEDVLFGVGFSEKWTLADGDAAYVHLRSATAVEETRLVYRDPAQGDAITVTPGATYDFGAYLGQHRCDAWLMVSFLDEEGEALKEVIAQPSEERPGGRRIASYAMAHAVAEAPVRATSAQIALCIRGRASDNRPDSLVLLARPWFGQASRRSTDRWRRSSRSPDVVSALRSLDSAGAARSRAWLPRGVDDGLAHEIDVRDGEGRSLIGSPLTYQLAEASLGAIEQVKGSTVFGWARAEAADGQPLEVRLAVDGAVVASATAGDSKRRAGGAGFRLTIPGACMDGLPHRLTLLAGQSNQVLDETAEILAVSNVPFDKLQRLGAAPPVWQSPAAAKRYEAMQASLRATTRAPAEETAAALERLKQISHAHDVLTTGFEALRAPYAPLSFPVHDKPTASVIVPAHNKFAVTYFCLAALLFAANEATFEVIVVDDGSSDETRGIEALVSGIKVVRHETAMGFVDACNDGAAQAVGDYVVLLNNDTEPTVGWLDAMLEVFATFDDVGAVGGKLVYPDGRLQEAGGGVWGTGDPWNYGRNGNAADPKYNYVRQVDYVSGACLMLPTTLWRRLGGLSELYRPAYFEDTDLCFQVRNAGLKVVYCPFAVVYHFEGATSGTDVTSGAKRYQEINRPTFKARWAELYKDNGARGVDVDLNKDRGVERRALMLDLQFPRGDQDAGSYAALQEIRLLQSLGFKVTFAPRRGLYMGAHTERLQKMGVEALYAPYTSSLEDLLMQRGREFDLIYITRYTVAEGLIPVIRRHAPQARLAFCNADLHFLRELREAVHMESDALLARAQATRKAEMAVVSAVDVTLSYNAAEHVVMEIESPGAKIAQAPWVVEVTSNPPPFEARRDLAFLGGFKHPPNKLAVEFYASEVAPLLRAVLPDVTCNVYGSGLTSEVEALRADGVAIRGFAPDLKSVYDTCRVFVAPLLTGAGLKGKVINALAYGVPSVLSPVAAEGADIRHGVEALIARTPEEWVQCIRRLYEDEALWQAMSVAAQAHARRYYSFETGQAHMRRALELGGLECRPSRRTLTARSIGGARRS